MPDSKQYSSALHTQALKLEPDFKEALRFLSFLDAPDAAFTFQLIANSQGAPTFHRHGSLLELARLLVWAQRKGSGVYVMINEGDGSGREAENVHRVRAVFADFDGAPLANLSAVHLQPHLLVESSPGRYHAYWRCDGLSLEGFPLVQATISNRLSSDPTVNDVCRVMRVPGFWHLKSEPFLTRIIEWNTHAPFSSAEILAEFPPEPSIAATRTRSNEPSSGSAGSFVEGGRNRLMTKFGGYLRQQGCTEEAIGRTLRELNLAACEPPLPEEEVGRIARSVSKYPAGEPRAGSLSPAHRDYLRSCGIQT